MGIYSVSSTALLIAFLLYLVATFFLEEQFVKIKTSVIRKQKQGLSV